MTPASFLCLCFAAIGCGMTEPTWLVRRSCDSSFFRPYPQDWPCATNAVCGRALVMDMWHRSMPRCHGFAFVAYADLRVPVGGRYSFRLEKTPRCVMSARLFVNGACPDEQPDGTVALEKGIASVMILCRQPQKEDVPEGKHPYADFRLMSRLQGTADFVSADVAWPRDPTVAERPVNGFEHEFAPKDGACREFCYRSFAIDVPEDGYYELGVAQARYAANIRICLDGLQIVGLQPRALDTERCYLGDEDDAGDRHGLRLGFVPRMTKVRYLRSGRHCLDVLVYPGPWDYDDSSVPKLMESGQLRIGYSRLSGKNPRQETGFWFEGRDDMVYAKGEQFQLSFGSACHVPREHVFEVTNRTAGGAAFVRKMPVDNRVRTFAYPCAEEGAFEYRVLDSRGRVVDGPWAFVVADMSPVARHRSRSEAIASAADRLVDAVECTEGRNGAHQLRDGAGASVVMTNAEGLAYRLPGPAGWRNKRVERLGKPGTRLFAEGNFRLATAEEIRRNRYRPSFSTLDWFAYTLRVRNPGRPHVVRCTVPNDQSRLVTCYAIDRKTGAYNGWNLHAGCGPACGETSYLSFFVWPNDAEVDVLVPNTTGNHGGKLDRRGAVVRIELLECADGHVPALPEAFGGWSETRNFGWSGEQGDFYVNERTMPPLWDDVDDWIRSEQNPHAYHSWNDLLIAWRRFGELSSYRGDSLCSGPLFSYGMQLYQGPASRICYPGRDIHGLGHHNEFVDPFDRDAFKLLLMKATAHRVKYVADFMMYVPERAGAFWAEAAGRPGETNGLFLSAEASGRPWRALTGALVNNPAHPVYRETVVRFCRELSRRYGRYPAFGGLRTRYWRGCEAGFEPWWKSERLGFDDFTVAQFARENGLDLPSVGTDSAAFEARRTDLTNRYGRAWRTWRAQKVLTLREEMLAALRSEAPQAQLYVTSVGDFARSAGLEPELYENKPELGYLPEQAESGIGGESVEINNLDGKTFEGFDVRPRQFRHADHGTNEFCAGSYPQGICCNRGYRAHPYQLQSSARALANNKLKLLRAGGEWCLPPADEGLRAFVRVYRAIPDLTYERFAAEHGVGEDAPYAVWFAPMEDATVVWFVNTTDKSLSLRARFDKPTGCAVDLVTGESRTSGHELVLNLDPFMPAVWRVSGACRPVGLDACVIGEGSGRIRRLWTMLDDFGRQVRATGAREVIASVGFDRQWRPREGMTYGGPDAVFEWENLVAPIREAAAHDDWLTVERLSLRLRAEHPWWFSLFGWPNDETHCATMKRERLAAPKTDFTIGGVRGSCRRISVTALFGGDYGPLSVLVDGKTLWTFPAGSTREPRWETRLTPVTLPWLSKGVSVRFEGAEGVRPAVAEASAPMEPPEAVTRFQAEDGRMFDIGRNRLFDVAVAETDTLSFWVKNCGRSPLVTICVAGLDACELQSGGKTVAAKVQDARPWYVATVTEARDEFTRFDLKIDRSKTDAKVGVAVFNTGNVVVRAGQSDEQETLR